MNIFLLIALIFIATFIIGRYLEKIRVPWIFAALLIGAGFAVYNPFSAITSSETFTFLAQLGMYFLLFLVGLELNLDALRKKKGFIIRSMLFIIFFEALVGSLVVHFIFGYSWFISMLIALSFATVGEAILIPILDEFKLVNKPLGQAIIGIGTADDLVEIATLIIASIIVGASAHANIVVVIGALIGLFLLTLGLTQLRKEREQFRFVSIESLFLFILFIFFIFVGIGFFAEAAPLAALLAGISLRLFLPLERLSAVENEIRALTYGFFGPLFFVWVGAELNIHYLITFPLLILLVVAVSNSAKIIASFIAARNELGTRGSILLGVGLSVRFSTSIIIIKFLFDNNVIGAGIFSVIVASSIVFKFIVPVLFSYLIVRWKMA